MRADRIGLGPEFGRNQVDRIAFVLEADAGELVVIRDQPDPADGGCGEDRRAAAGRLALVVEADIIVLESEILIVKCDILGLES